MSSSTSLGVAIMAAVVFSVLVIPSTCAFCWWRSYYPIRGREISLVVMLMVFLWFVNIFPLMSFYVGCWSEYWFQVIVREVYWIYMVRLVVLILKFEISRAVNFFKNPTHFEDVSEHQTNWYISLRRVTHPNIYLGFLVILFSASVVNAIVQGTYYGCPMPGRIGSIFQLEAMAYTVVLQLLGLKLCKFSNDGFQLKRELLIVNGMAILTILAFILEVWIPGFQWITLHVSHWMTVFVILIYPTVRVLLEHRKRQNNTNLVLRLSEVLKKEPSLSQQFRLFLESEFSQESLIFIYDLWKIRTEFFKEQAKPKIKIDTQLKLPLNITKASSNNESVSPSLDSECLRLKRTYIQVNAPMQINISNRVRVSCESMIDDGLLLNAFKDCEEEVLNLLKSDPWVRFLNTQAVADWKKKGEVVGAEYVIQMSTMRTHSPDNISTPNLSNTLFDEDQLPTSTSSIIEV